MTDVREIAQTSLDARPTEEQSGRAEFDVPPEILQAARDAGRQLIGADKQAALYAALARAQGQFEAIKKDKTMEARGGKVVGYPSLAAMIDGTRAELAAENLAVVQTFRGDNLVTSLLHADGGMVESVMPLPRAGLSWHEYGSACTYARRYSLAALLNVAPDEDDDGKAAQDATAATESRSGHSRRAAAPPKAENGSDGFDRDKAFKAAKAIEKRLIAAGLTEEAFKAGVESDYGTPHVSALTDEQLADLVEKLREAEKAIPA